MIVRLFVASAMALCLGLLLGSCSSISDAVADHWPHWAGGMPAGVPPRPGEPGYADYISHRQAIEAAASASASGRSAAADKTNAQATPSGNRPANDAGVVQGGLY
jgi:hypothetical protein